MVWVSLYGFFSWQKARGSQAESGQHKKTVTVLVELFPTKNCGINDYFHLLHFDHCLTTKVAQDVKLVSPISRHFIFEEIYMREGGERDGDVEREREGSERGWLTELYLPKDTSLGTSAWSVNDSERGEREEEEKEERERGRERRRRREREEGEEEEGERENSNSNSKTLTLKRERGRQTDRQRESSLSVVSFHPSQEITQRQDHLDPCN